MRNITVGVLIDVMRSSRNGYASHIHATLPLSPVNPRPDRRRRWGRREHRVRCHTVCAHVAPQQERPHSWVVSCWSAWSSFVARDRRETARRARARGARGTSV